MSGSWKRAKNLSSDWKNFYSCTNWIRLNTPRDAIVISKKPSFFICGR